MKQSILLISLLFSFIACNNNSSDPEQNTVDQSIKVKKQVDTKTETLISSGIDYSNMDKSIAASDDFYRHVNGKWLNEFELPADKSNFGSFTSLGELSRERVKDIIAELSKSENQPGSDNQKIADIYKSFMDTGALEEKGISAIKSGLDKIKAITNRKELSEYAGYADIYTDSPVSMYVSIDKKQSDKHIVYLTQSGIGLPNRDYYFTDNEKSQQIRDKYKSHIKNMFTLANLDKPTDSASLIFNMEKDIAEGHWTPIQNRDSENTYNKYTFNAVQKIVPNLDWSAWLSHSMIDSPEEIIVTQPSHLEKYNQTLLKYSIDQWKTYYQWQLLSSTAPYLNEKFAVENFSFFGTVLSGTTEQEPRWKRGVDLANSLTGELIGKVYVKKHFPQEAKDRMVKMIENLREAYGQSIDDLDWMSDETKVKAKVKLAKFDPKVGYPDVWRDYSKMNIKGTDLIANLTETTRFYTHRNRSKIGKPIDRTEWGMNPQRVNAYYNPLKNEIVFPAAILQAPFFNLQADEAVNYGGIGAVIGHEMGHGFDDQGSKYDGDGNLKNWWTDEDRTKFEALTSKLIKQYDAYTVVDGTHVKGEFTQGENIGDLSGLAISYKAFKNHYSDNRIIDGYTPEQRFFFGWAQVWMRKYRDEELLRRIDVDPHSPSEFRTNGILKNMPEFYQAFDVKEGDGMYLPPEERVKIW